MVTRWADILIAAAAPVGLTGTASATPDADTGQTSSVVEPDSSTASSGPDKSQFARFVPRVTDTEHQIDYANWGEVLSRIVVGLGPSLRTGAPRPESFTSTRMLKGHTSRLRLEGSRVAYNLFGEGFAAALTDYRRELERVGTELDIASLSRNEQLAFWLNLHNVAIIEQIATAYPVIIPSKIMIDGAALHDAPFIEVSGVRMSPRDIRTRIVYANWSDPRVIYGFFHGDIGGPMIQPLEFNRNNVGLLLQENAVEFVNSLRGVELRGDTLHVSTLYSEAYKFYFPRFERNLREHLSQFAQAAVATDLFRAHRFRATIYEDDIADLARGQRQVIVAQVSSSGRNPVAYSSAVPVNIQRFVIERRNKQEILRRQGQRIWSIIVEPSDPAEVDEVE